MKNQWFISIKKNDGNVFDISGLQHNYPPKGYYWADPFLYQKDGKDYIFYELYNYKKGVIAYSEIREDMTFTDPTIVLELDSHISYPFIFEDNKKLYIVPESGLDRNIKLYECVSFPDKWEFKGNIIPNVSTGDNNIIRNRDKYYLFTTIQPQLKHDLVIYESDSLMGDWRVVGRGNVKSSRSGGRIFSKDGQIIRTCQNSPKGKGYGYGIIFKNFSFNPQSTEYKEKIIHQIDPTWHPDIIGTHHFDFNDKYIVVDGKIKIDD